MEDTAIVALYWQRSEWAIPETEKKYARLCHGIAYRILTSREDAEECVNDTWLRAWNAMPDKRPATLPPFLGRITRNLALDRVEARSRRKRGGGETELALEELSDCIGSGGVEQQIEFQELERAVNAFVAALPETERMVFVARYWYLCPLSEIAARFGFSLSKTKSLLFRLRGRLREHLREGGYL